MDLVYKILLFSLISNYLAIGKLFDIFIWNNRITRTEIVFYKKERLESIGRICFFVKIEKEIKKKLSIQKKTRFDFRIIERISNKRNRKLISIENNKFNCLRTLLIRRFIFNIIYLDDSKYELRLLL